MSATESKISAEGWIKFAAWVTTHWNSWGPRKWGIALPIAVVGLLLLLAHVGPPIQGMLARNAAPIAASAAVSEPAAAPVPEVHRSRVYIDEIHPSGDGLLTVEGCDVRGGGPGGSVSIAAGDNGTAKVLLDNVSIGGGDGPGGGGNVHLRAGNGGRNGPGGDMVIRGGSVRGGAAK